MFIAINEPGLRLYGEIDSPVQLNEVLDKLSATMIRKVLKATGDNRSLTARILGIKRTTLVQRLKREAITRRARISWASVTTGVTYETVNEDTVVNY